MFALPNARGHTCTNQPKRKRKAKHALAVLKAQAPAAARAAWQLVGRVPVGSYPVDVDATPRHKKLVWLAAKGLGVGPNPNGPNPLSPNDSDNNINRVPVPARRSCAG